MKIDKDTFLKGCRRPEGYAELRLGMSLYPKQKQELQELRKPGCSVSFMSCNEGGKTKRVITAFILWHLEAARGPVISTSGSFRQIKDQLNPMLHEFESKFPGWKFLDCRIETPWNGVFWDGFSTTEAGRFEGHHSEIGKPLAIVIDEAKSVNDSIYGAIDRCKPARFLQTSSPGFAEGGFYDSWHSQRALHTLIQQDWDEVPNWSQEDKDRIAAKYPLGMQDPFVLSVAGKAFIPMVEDAIISLRALQHCIDNPPRISGTEVKYFCDFAAGGAENVLARRTGNRIELIDCWRDTNTMAAVGRFISHFVRLKAKTDEIEGDADGLGKPMCDAMAEAGWPIRPFHGGEAPRFDEHYENLSAEGWYSLALDVERGKIILPDDEELKAQLVCRKKKYSSKGKLGVESKKEMAKRGLPSPDRADAVVGAHTPRILPATVSFDEVQRGWLDQINEGLDDERRGGWDAGG